jgi:hypothetical protein
MRRKGVRLKYLAYRTISMGKAGKRPTDWPRGAGTGRVF